jgi:hypothetical protein
MKGQVSTELMVIIALVLLIFIPLLVLVYMKASEANQQIGSYQAELAVSRLASLANSVGSLGTSTSVTTDVYIPPNTVSLETKQAGQGAEIVLKVRTSQGDTEVADIVKYPMKSYGTISEATTTGTWMKVRISSEYDPGSGETRITMTKGTSTP